MLRSSEPRRSQDAFSFPVIQDQLSELLQGKSHPALRQRLSLFPLLGLQLTAMGLRGVGSTHSLDHEHERKNEQSQSGEGACYCGRVCDERYGVAVSRPSLYYIKRRKNIINAFSTEIFATKTTLRFAPLRSSK